MDGLLYPRETRQAGIVIRSPQATVSLEDRLTTRSSDDEEVLEYYGTGRRNFEMAASLTTEPSSDNDFTRGYMREMIDEGFASTKRRAGEFWSKHHAQRHTEVRDEETGCDTRRDQQGRQDRHPGRERGDEGHVVISYTEHHFHRVADVARKDDDVSGDVTGASGLEGRRRGSRGGPGRFRAVANRVYDVDGRLNSSV
ncbi:hypothetical protein Sjap_012655 [Stephania japonica]|uniref:Uncharacterized protein n=1 Tax=Stephania japonica TaxID=461633 RepID=A0AAP0NXV1_9MAGN